MQNCTRHDNCWGIGVVHLKRLEKQGPPACFHHSKRPLNYGASLGMVVIEAGLHSPLHWLPVWSNNGHRMNDAGVASIPQKEVSLWRIQCIFIHLAVSQDSSVIDRTRISHKNIKQPALPITNCLHLNGWEELSIDVVLASGSSGGFYADMTSIYSTHTLGEDGAVGQIFKTKDNLIKVLCIWELNDLLAQGCNLMVPVWTSLQTDDTGTWKARDTTLYDRPCASQYTVISVVMRCPHPCASSCGSILINASIESRLSRKSTLRFCLPSKYNFSSGTVAFISV